MITLSDAKVMSPRPTNETTPLRDRLTPRVLSRHLGVANEAMPEANSIAILYSDGGVITAAGDVARLLRDRLGPIRGLRFLSPRGAANAIRWSGITDAGEVVAGKLVLHAGMRGDRVVSWATLEIEPTPKQSKTLLATGPRARLREIANRAREVIRNVRERPTYGPAELVGALVGLVDLAEEGPDDEGVT